MEEGFVFDETVSSMVIYTGLPVRLDSSYMIDITLLVVPVENKKIKIMKLQLKYAIL